MMRSGYSLRSVLFPRKCMLCRCVLAEDETDLCHICRTDAPEYPYGAVNPAPAGKISLHFLDSFTAVWYYEGNVRKCIHRYKFRKATHLAPKLGRFLGMKLLQQGPSEYDVLTWVPVGRLRRLCRGYDQCELLANAVGEELGIKPQRLLKKIRNTPPQSGIVSAAERKANVLGAFAVNPQAEVRGKRILLVDDVYTTGATSEECARVLLTAGAQEVHCAVAAAVRHRKNKPSG